MAGSRLEMLNGSSASVKVPTIQEHWCGRDLGLSNSSHVWLVDLSDCWMQKRKLANNHTCAELSLKNEPDWCAFLDVELLDAYELHMGHWSIGLLLGGFRVPLPCCYVGLWTWRPSDQNCIQMTLCTCCKLCPHRLSRADWFCQGPGVSSQLPLFLQHVGLQKPCRRGHWPSSFLEPSLLQCVTASGAEDATVILHFAL